MPALRRRSPRFSLRYKDRTQSSQIRDERNEFGERRINVRIAFEDFPLKRATHEIAVIARTEAAWLALSCPRTQLPRYCRVCSAKKKRRKKHVRKKQKSRATTLSLRSNVEVSRQFGHVKNSPKDLKISR